MLLSDFDYDLDEKLIAQTPIEPRNFSRLMVLKTHDKTIEHKHFYDLKEFLEPGDTLVLNDTKVIPARLIGHKETGAKIEVFLLRALAQKNQWEVLVKPGRKVQIGAKIFFDENLSCEVLEKTDFGGRVVAFSFDETKSFEKILDDVGQMPLPPYIHQQLSKENSQRYQTVFNHEFGSAAAPTAGLHFTKEQLNDLQASGVNISFVTLHVGLGTFRPVNTDVIEEHQMHSEFYSIDEKTIHLLEQTRANHKKIVACGTTVVRTLESFAQKKKLSGWTDIFIYPGYKFQWIDAMITNFHLPKSTLLMLVSAFADREFILQAYHEAIQRSYRFFSFGDAMLILK